MNKDEMTYCRRLKWNNYESHKFEWLIFLSDFLLIFLEVSTFFKYENSKKGIKIPTGEKINCRGRQGDWPQVILQLLPRWHGWRAANQLRNFRVYWGFTYPHIPPYTHAHYASFSHEHIEDKIEDTAKWTYLSVAFTVAYSYPDKMSDWNNTALTPLICTRYQTENKLSLDFKLKYGPLNLQSWKLLCNALLKFCKIS